MKVIKVIKTVILGGLLMSASFGYAFEKDKPSSQSFGPEQSQEQLKQQQQYQGFVPPVGQVPDRVDSIQPEGSVSQSDNKSFASADEAKAKASFDLANKKIQEARNPLSPFFLLAMVAGVILVATMAIKAYSDKVVPVPKHLK